MRSGFLSTENRGTVPGGEARAETFFVPTYDIDRLVSSFIMAYFSVDFPLPGIPANSTSISRFLTQEMINF